MGKAKKIGIGIGIIILGFFVLVAIAQLTTTDEDRARWQAEKEAEERQIQAQERERERELAKYQEVYAENGRLKYRPYWLVGDGYKELEFTGKITRDSTCANLAEAANAENIFENFYLGLWLGGCVDNPGDDYKDILWKGSYLKYRLYWDQEDMHKNIDNRGTLSFSP